MSLLEKIRNKMLRTKNLDPDMRKAIESLGKNKRRPLGKFSPWAWALEPVRGCNLTCWHCPARLLPRKKYIYMDMDLWKSIWKIIAEVNPRCRVEMANTGEPTLHPNIYEMISVARKISPHSQIQITTNGTTLIKGQITYKKLFEAGLNIVYTDMYASKEVHKRLAKKSGYPYYTYYDSPKNAPNAWKYHDDPNIQFIALADTPDNWPKQKIKRGALGTFLNNIDFDHPSAKRLGIKPVIKAPQRRCNQPMKYVQVFVDGTYMMCCQDVFNEAKIKQNAYGGVKEFLKFWLGKRMQKTRQLLRDKDRSLHKVCCKCNIAFSRCDMKFWKSGSFKYYWDGKSLKPMADWKPKEEKKQKQKSFKPLL